MNDDFNPNNPDYDFKEVETEQVRYDDDDFTSDNLMECLKYAKENKEFYPLTKAILQQEHIINICNLEIDFITQIAKDLENDFFVNKLNHIKKLLNSNQK